MQAIRFGALYLSRHRDVAGAKHESLSYGNESPVMTSVQVRPDGTRVWVVATGFERLFIEGFKAFDGQLQDVYTALDRQIAREERHNKGPQLTRTQLYEKYQDLVETYLDNHEGFRLLAMDVMPKLRKAINLDAGQELDLRG